MLRRLLTPRWILGLLLTLVAAAVMVRLGMWQLDVAGHRHSLQNYSYAVEWVLFAAFTVFCFVKLLRDESRETDHENEEPEITSVVIPPPVAPVEEPQDDELAAYNAYLAQLNAKPNR